MIFREVVQQSNDGILGTPCVSTVTVYEDERADCVRLSAGLHHLAGWTVTFNPSTLVAVCRKKIPGKGLVVRTIWIEAYDPARDGEEVSA